MAKRWPADGRIRGVGTRQNAGRVVTGRVDNSEGATARAVVQFVRAGCGLANRRSKRRANSWRHRLRLPPRPARTSPELRAKPSPLGTPSRAAGSARRSECGGTVTTKGGSRSTWGRTRRPSRIASATCAAPLEPTSFLTSTTPGGRTPTNRNESGTTGIVRDIDSPMCPRAILGVAARKR